MVTTAPPTTPTYGARDLRLGLIGTVVAVSMWGLSGVIIKSIDMDTMAVAFWRFLIYGALMCGFLVVRGQRPGIRVMRASFWGGLSLAMDVVFFFTAVRLTNVVNATTIGSLQPLVVAVFASRMFGERIRGKDVAAALVAIAAVVVIVVESAGTPEWSGAGDLLSVCAVFAWSFYFVFAKRSVGVITSTEYTAGTAVWTTIVTGLTGIVFAQDMSAPGPGDWLAMVALVLGAGILGHALMNWSLVRIPLWLGSTLTLMIPVISSIAAWIWLDEPLTATQIVAMGVVLAALTVIVIGQGQPDVATAPPAAST
jgi:drug/metabolite transporter (DMT)-like permease